MVQPPVPMEVIRDATPADAPGIAEIYNHYIVNTVVTFEEVVVSAEEMGRRVGAVTERFPWLVLEAEGRVAGYAYASAWHARAAYRHSVEATVYLAKDCVGRGLGSTLYRALLDRLPTLGVHTVIGGIALPNEASVAIHEKFGFEKAAHYRQVGRKFDRWIDVGYWQLILRGTELREGAKPT